MWIKEHWMNWTFCLPLTAFGRESPFSMTNWGSWGHGKHLTFTECISRGPFWQVSVNPELPGSWLVIHHCFSCVGMVQGWREIGESLLVCSFLLFPPVEKEKKKAGFSPSWWPNCPDSALNLADGGSSFVHEWLCVSYLDSRIYLNVDKPQLSQICLIYFHLMLYFFPKYLAHHLTPTLLFFQRLNKQKYVPLPAPKPSPPE